MKNILLSAVSLAVVFAGQAWSQSIYFGQGCYPAPRPALSVGWGGGGWQVAASLGGGGWGANYAVPYGAPYVRPVAVPVWTTGFNCYPAPVVSYYGTSYRSSPAFVVPRRYGAAPVVADPVFRPAAPVYPVRAVRVTR